MKKQMKLLHSVFHCDFNHPLPWRKMFICAVTATAPLAAGSFFGQTEEAVLGSLLGVALTLNDHADEWKKRWLHLLSTAFYLISGYVAGSLLNNHFSFLFLFLISLTFLLGLVKGKGVELERLLLFTLLNVVTIAGLKLSLPHVTTGSLYGILNFFLYSALVFLIDKNADKITGMKAKRQILKTSVLTKPSWSFAFILSGLTALSYLIAHGFHLQREYWIAGTVIIVMIPDHAGTYIRSLQRFLGTLAGIVLVFFLTSVFGNEFVAALAAVFLCAAFIPAGMRVNFFVGNTFISGFVFCLLKLTLPPDFDLKGLAVLRITDIAIGGVIGSAGITVYQSLPRAYNLFHRLHLRRE